jgi:hypothetical protein
MLLTNKEYLPIISVQGQIMHPALRPSPKIDTEGRVHYFPGTGGITYNVKVGDPACGWAGDHLEPGVSLKNSDEVMNRALTTYSCVGNEAIVVSGDAKGARGFVTGTHGGVEHTLVYFDDDTLAKLTLDDKVLVRACGQGLELCEHPDVVLRSVSPELLGKLNIRQEGGALHVGVARRVPAAIMGSGLGSLPSANGDYDITLFCPKGTEGYGLTGRDGLRLGDIVAIEDADTRFGRTYRAGAVTIGVVIHCDCVSPGHGPGVTTLMSCVLSGKLVAFEDANANLRNMFGR